MNFPVSPDMPILKVVNIFFIMLQVMKQLIFLPNTLSLWGKCCLFSGTFNVQVLKSSTWMKLPASSASIVLMHKRIA